MPSVQQLRNRLLKKLSELFQLDQPDLDFGFYRIMHARAKEVQDFIAGDLLKIIKDTFGDMDDSRKSELQAVYEKAVQTAGEYGAPDPYASEPVKKAKAELDAVRDIAAREADVYEHLYRFFDRYYDDGDFISRRYYTRETPGKAAPFAVPYNGEEVKLHWANADQYYIKSAEYFSNFTFDLCQAKEIQTLDNGPSEAQKNGDKRRSMKVHFRVVDATEGEHGNVKANGQNKRFFMIRKDNPVELNESGEMLVNFEFLPDPEKSGQDQTWREKRNAQALETILNKVEEMSRSEDEQGRRLAEYLQLVTIPAPTEKEKNRPLLARYIHQYTARNTMDYFIHKDLGTFLRRELDFYIKNEVMRLDDIENADAPAVESYLYKIKVLRKIAGKLIDFLAQLEDFQKKLWLKKKFVTETNYCITLDRVPEELYPEIAANEAQTEEWLRLFAIDEIVAEIGNPGFTRPLSPEFLKANQNLVLDTRFFDDVFKAELLASIEDFDEQCDGLLIHSENFQALNLLQKRYREQVKCVYIDPPYNTGGDGFTYKDTYQHSTWLSLMYDRLVYSNCIQSQDGFIAVSIDDVEFSKLQFLLTITYGANNEIASIVWDRNRKNDAKFFSVGHEYMSIYSKNKHFLKDNKTELREYKPGIDDAKKKFNTLYKTKKGNLEEILSEWRNYIVTIKDPETKSVLSKYPKISHRGPFRDDGNINWPGKGGPRYEILHPVTQKPVKLPKSGWRYANPEKFWERYRSGDISFGEDEKTVPGVIYYLFESSQQVMGSVFWSYAQSTYENFLAISGERSFDNPKDIKDIARITNYLSTDSSLILDFFAGSGTTAHAVINLNREENGKRKYILIEMGDYFNTVLKPRISKVVYSENWKDGKPTSRHSGISHCFKYLRLESYEDTLNNLRLDDSLSKSPLMENPSLKEDYMLRYMLDVETRGSDSLLNIDRLTDPWDYRMFVKQPGSDAQILQKIDIIETFHYLIGLRIVRISAPQWFDAAFIRTEDPEIPGDQKTRLLTDGAIQQIQKPPPEIMKSLWKFQKIQGWVPGDPLNPNNGKKEKMLIIWRTMPAFAQLRKEGEFEGIQGMEGDNLMLDEWFQSLRSSTGEFGFDTVYVNGSNNLANLKPDHENWKVRLTEEEFMKRMWEAEEV